MQEKEKRPNNKLYRHYIGGNGKLATECWLVENRAFTGPAYPLVSESDPERTMRLPSSWIGAPRAAELWTTDGDPQSAYAVLLAAAKKDLETAKGRLGVYENLYARLRAAGGKRDLSDPSAPERAYGKFLIMGRAQSGKTTVAKLLSEATGIGILKTSTSRPKRSPDEDTYHFYTPKEASAIPMARKLFHTLAVDGFERWTGMDDFLDAGIAVLDPTAMVPAIRLWQAQGFKVTVVYCDDPVESRRSRWMKSVARPDGSDWDDAIVKFNHREKTEGPMFDALDERLKNMEDASAADAMLYPSATPEAFRLAGEDRLEIYKSRHGYGPEELVKYLMQALPSDDEAGLVPYRELASAEDVIFDPEDYASEEWSMLCRVFGLVPECAARIALSKPLVKCSVYPGAEKDCDFRKEASR